MSLTDSSPAQNRPLVGQGSAAYNASELNGGHWLPGHPKSGWLIAAAPANPQVKHMIGVFDPPQAHSGLQAGDSRRSDWRPARPKPQVTRVIGVFDPHRRVEQDPEELWTSVLEAGHAAADAAGGAIDAVGLANQGETVLAWDRRTGEPSSVALSWQDRRASDICDRRTAVACLTSRSARSRGRERHTCQHRRVVSYFEWPGDVEQVSKEPEAKK